ncbi:OmpA family protein [uncultured Tateyamaria sp.]|uniref:OmpA family protein n=1 Tax=uncultured Tateyamaria sp. TaxID=455651 RepID=UPI00261F71C2|nr:OmpA family protein [uncultured Tateyamaria sp.]
MRRILGLLATVLTVYTTSVAADPFGAGWNLETTASSLSFSAGTAGSDTATTFFTDTSGTISDDGTAEISISLDAIDSGDALLDARVRFLLLESFRLPQAMVKASIDPQLVTGLRPGDRIKVTQPLTLELNGQSREIEATLDLILLAEDVVSVASDAPIVLDLGDFNYLGGLETLERVARVDILPRIEVSFELLFKANPQQQSADSLDIAALNACARQIETIGQSDQVYFTTGSVQLEKKSYPLLSAVADTMRSCPGLNLRIEGHTDNLGSAKANKRLSVGRAAEVVIYLADKGIDPERLNATGFGEDRPIADNATRRGRWQNRRVEFVPLGF